MNSTDLSGWLYQGDKSTHRPTDLGYYVGYKIVEAYYKGAADKARAVKEIIEVRDFTAFLEASGYTKRFE